MSELKAEKEKDDGTEKFRCEECGAMLYMYKNNVTGEINSVCPECGGGDRFLAMAAQVAIQFRELAIAYKDTAESFLASSEKIKQIWPSSTLTIQHKIGNTPVHVVFQNEDPIGIIYNGESLSSDISMSIIASEHQAIMDSYRNINPAF